MTLKLSGYDKPTPTDFANDHLATVLSDHVTPDFALIYPQLSPAEVEKVTAAYFKKVLKIEHEILDASGWGVQMNWVLDQHEAAQQERKIRRKGKTNAG